MRRAGYLAPAAFGPGVALSAERPRQSDASTHRQTVPTRRKLVETRQDARDDRCFVVAALDP